MRIVAVDPGLTSGVAVYGTESRSFLSMELPTHAAISEVERFLYLGTGLVVCESWTPRPGVRTFQPEALESIGALRYLCRKLRTEFQLQSPAEAKSFATNKKLKTLGWRRPSEGGHADDAARHLLVAAVRVDAIDPAIFLEKSSV